jgi:hypothetical protein
MPEDKRKGRQPPPFGKAREAGLKAALGGLGLMLAPTMLSGLPGQIRLASREQQPRPPKGAKRGRGR